MNNLMDPNLTNGSAMNEIKVTGCDCSSDDDKFYEAIFRFTDQILMEENIEQQPYLFFDPLGIKPTEESFYNVIGQSHPSSPNFLASASCRGQVNGSSTRSRGSIDLRWRYGLPILSEPAVSHHPNSLTTNTELSSPILFSNSNDSALQFREVSNEASKLFPVDNHQLVREAPKNFENGKRKNSLTGDLELDSEEGRSYKQLATYVEESGLSDMFDRVLLDNEGEESMEKLNQIGERQVFNVGKDGAAKKHRKKKKKNEKETVDLRTLLTRCAQAVSSNDYRTANEQLNLIRKNSSPFGDGSQRVAHFFANALEARLSGTGTRTEIFFTSIASKKTTASDMLMAYHVHILSCPFKKISYLFANDMILQVAIQAKTLHIIDFGINYGYQWPILIQQLSSLPGGPHKLRITGIEYPHSGFRPAAQIEENGRRLSIYCERFNVRFQYQVIASRNWETIRIEDLKLDSKDVLAVNCFLRFKNLLDETADVNCPRDFVLGLIRKMNPDIFVHSIVNGSYNAPFFITRFKEALFHFSALYDAWDATLSRENEGRLKYEREFYGREIMNVIACEGLERVERPETYKRWQVRGFRAGFKQLPLKQEVMDKYRNKTKAWYHKDFVLDQDGQWMLQGWKGRIVYASCCWVPEHSK